MVGSLCAAPTLPAHCWVPTVPGVPQGRCTAQAGQGCGCPGFLCESRIFPCDYTRFNRLFFFSSSKEKILVKTRQKETILYRKKIHFCFSIPKLRIKKKKIKLLNICSWLELRPLRKLAVSNFSVLITTPFSHQVAGISRQMVFNLP